MSEFSTTVAFTIDEGICGDQFKVSVIHDTATGKPLSVHFWSYRNESSVTVPFDLWDRVVSAVERAKEY